MNRTTPAQRTVHALSLALAGWLLPLAALGALPQVQFTPLHADGIYRLGQRVGWTVTVPPGAPDPRGHFAYTIKRNDLDVMQTGRFSLASGKATLAVRCDVPAMLYVTVDYEPTPTALSRTEYRTLNHSLKALLSKEDPALERLFERYPHYQPLTAQFPFGAYAEHRVATLGAAVAPTRLTPSLRAPRNFNAFWARQLAALRHVPMRVRLTPMPTAEAGVKVFRVRLKSLGSHVRGYLAMPQRAGRFPALIIYQWAGVYPLQRAWATHRAAEGWLVFDVDSHDIAPSSGTAVPQNYPAIGVHSPQTSYFLGMYLRDTRALQYIRHNRFWNGQTLVLTGTSMGGQQSLATAGLNPGQETAVIVNEPSGADMNGLAHGRRPGYPFYATQDPTVLHTAAYFDTVNFAPHITAPTLIAMGFIDTTAPPAGLWSELNEIPAPKEAVPMIDSAHNNITPDKQDAWLSRSEELLAQLAHGDPFVPDQALTRPQTRRVQ